MCLSRPSAPSAPPPPPPPPPAPSEEVEAVQSARDRERRRVLATQGRKSTMLTGPQGVTEAAPTAQKTLLGA